VPYKCLTCEFKTTSARGLAQHIIGATSHVNKHIEWVESHGLSYPQIVRSSNYGALIDLIEKECRIEH
jgi:hypothetical protein